MSKIEDLCQEAIEKNEDAVQDYKNGNEKSINFLTGYVMRMVEGKANPKLVEKVLREKLKC